MIVGFMVGEFTRIAGHTERHAAVNLIQHDPRRQAVPVAHGYNAGFCAASDFRTGAAARPAQTTSSSE